MTWRAPAALCVALLHLAVAAPARAGEGESGSTAYNALTGVGATVCTLLYSPLKLGYALGGSLISGLAWMWTLGDTEVSGPILDAAVRGDYVVTPAHLEGRRDLRFVGRRY